MPHDENVFYALVALDEVDCMWVLVHWHYEPSKQEMEEMWETRNPELSDAKPLLLSGKQAEIFFK
jgi:hypothetical protein